jgi:hypothetical protein
VRPAAGAALDDNPRRDPARHGRGERIADAAVHVSGLAVTLAGCAALAATPPRAAGLGTVVALGPYAAALLTMLDCSAKSGPARPAAQRSGCRCRRGSSASRSSRICCSAGPGWPLPRPLAGGAPAPGSAAGRGRGALQLRCRRPPFAWLRHHDAFWRALVVATAARHYAVVPRLAQQALSAAPNPCGSRARPPSARSSRCGG